MEPRGESLARTLERVVEARGRLLQVERAPVPGPAGATASSALRLVFDVGIVTLRPGGREGALEVEIGEAGSARSEVFVPASEEEPWWAVMGCPLTRVEERPTGGVRVQFRAEQENPRRFDLLPRGGGVEAWLAGQVPEGEKA
jgi:hypothetical protein